MKDGIEKYFGEEVVEKDAIETPEATEIKELNPEQSKEVLAEIKQEQTEDSGEIEEPKDEVVPAEEETVLEVIEKDTQEDLPEVQASDLPEGVDDLVKFMNDTGGTVEDYLSLNKDYSALGDKNLLKEFYKKTKSGLDNDDIDYLVNKFDINEEDMEEDELRERKIALKEELSNAKQYLNGQKDKYYKELKSGGSAREDAFNSANRKAQDAAAKQFQDKTEETFKGFEGFVFDLGEKRKSVRYRVNDVEKLKNNQGSLDKIFGEYFKDGNLEDAEGFHKAAFAASNADNIASLFFEQGYAQAVEELHKTSKNVDFEATKRAPTSDSKLQPGQAREIKQQGTSSRGLNLKWNDL